MELKNTRAEAVEYYRPFLEKSDTESLRWLCQHDLFFLLLVGCNRVDINKDWLFDRCREVQANPDEHLDLWSRGHYKSTIITFGQTIQDILNNPEITFGIFSHTRPVAKAFLSQIKRELEINTFLIDLFPDVLYRDPHKNSKKWSLDDGILVKRKGNPKESTVEAWGLVDGQPTSKHYKVKVYDDIVTKESVTTPEQIKKTTEGWETSLNLGSDDPLNPCKSRYAGTRWHSQDTYAVILERKSAVERKYPATDNGKFDGKPVLWTQAIFDKKVADMGVYVAAAQLLLNPVADAAQSFNEKWLSSYDIMQNYDKWNKYILVDAANAKKKSSDYTVMAVIGLAPDNNYYLLHAVRDRMNLSERTKCLFSLVRQWEPLSVGYEEYGLQSDIQHINYVQEIENFRFNIIKLSGAMPKIDRIKRMVPVFERHRFWMPHRLQYITIDGKVRDFILEFLKDEYKTFPVCAHDDMFDCISRILDEDLMAVFPKIESKTPITLPINNQGDFAVKDYDPLKERD